MGTKNQPEASALHGKMGWSSRHQASKINGTTEMAIRRKTVFQQPMVFRASTSSMVYSAGSRQEAGGCESSDESHGFPWPRIPTGGSWRGRTLHKKPWQKPWIFFNGIQSPRSLGQILGTRKMVTNVSRPSQDPILDPVRFSQDMMEASCVWLDTSFAQLAQKKIRTAGASNDGALPLMKLGLELTTAAPPSFVA